MILVWLGGLLLVVLIDAVKESCQDQPNWKNLHKGLAGRPAVEHKFAAARDLFGSPLYPEDPCAAPPPVAEPVAGSRWIRRRNQKRRPKSHAAARTSQARA